MRVLVACKRGSVAPRDKWGHCLCDLCKAAIKAGKSDRTEYHRKWRAENPEKVKQYTAKWNKANPEKRKAIEKAWKKANPEKVKQYSRDAGKKWAANNSGHRLEIVRARQLAKRQRTPPWADRSAIRAVYIEAARMTKVTGIPHEVDHIYPLQGESVSGLHVHNNLQVITRYQNRSKGTKTCAA